MLYGPFSAAYPGNAIGAVVNIKTRMPEKLEASATAGLNLQGFDQYGTHGSYPAYQLAGTIGDRMGPFSWFLSANHADSRSQPLAYVTVAQPAGTATGGTPVTGAFDKLNRTGQPIFVVGAGGFEHQRQDNLKAKFALDLPHSMKLTVADRCLPQHTNSHAQTYLEDAAGNDVFSGPVNIGGRRVTHPRERLFQPGVSFRRAALDAFRDARAGRRHVLLVAGRLGLRLREGRPAHTFDRASRREGRRRRVDRAHGRHRLANARPAWFHEVAQRS